MILLFALLSLLVFSCGDGTDHASYSSSMASEDEAVWVERGMEIQKATFAALQAELTKKISEEGFVEAIDYCRARAIPLTDSMAALHDVRVRRVTLRTRHPANLADIAERVVIVDYERTLQADPTAELKPQIRQDDQKVYYYAPIRVQGLCLNCHGDPERDISQDVKDKLAQLYPKDRATGYSLNDLRGIWSIRFNR